MIVLVSLVHLYLYGSLAACSFSLKWIAIASERVTRVSQKKVALVQMAITPLKLNRNKTSGWAVWKIQHKCCRIGSFFSFWHLMDFRGVIAIWTRAPFFWDSQYMYISIHSTAILLLELLMTYACRMKGVCSN